MNDFDPPAVLGATDVAAALHSCLAVPRWAAELAADAPYADADALLAAAEAALTPFAPSELAEALAGHPRIGDRPAGEGRAAAFSRAEQAASTSDDEALAARLAEGNRAYEAKFDRVFLIRAAGRSRAEIVAELERRLALDDAEELPIVAEQLREITLLRLRALADAGEVPGLLGPALAESDSSEGEQA